MRPEESEIRSLDPAGLTEFETGSTNSLAPFEDESSTLLDEYATASPSLLDEFDGHLETIYSVHPVPDESGSNREDSEDVDEQQWPDEPEEPAESDIEPGSVFDEVDEIVGKEEPAPGEASAGSQARRPVIGFICKHATDFPGITDSHGRMIGRRSVHLIELPCAAIVKPKWLTQTLEKGASGVFVLACVPGVCHHRRGSCIIQGRIDGSRPPSLEAVADKSRIRLIHGHVNSRDDVLRQIEEFLLEVSRLDGAVGSKAITPELLPGEFGEIEPME
jgi:coenzyme F420-reducing hydrogenase delta subunit